ncbi:MAG: glycosyltransferase family 39 protein [Oscillospiraceae bacterium]|jgi:4-amino-4-deoxy-L-arabinose transferase-like glycosyltransferase|nr:glycosyltransferase family 39 protein [Oscillospiraceae bacterium]
MLARLLEKSRLPGGALLALTAFVCLSPVKAQADIGHAQAVMLALLLICGGAALACRELTCERRAALLMAAGLVMRFGYVWYTVYWVRQHDIGVWDSAQGLFVRGHAYYIDHYVKHWLPPAEAFWQHHHPPLFHFLSGKLLALLRLCGKGYHEAYESLQLMGAAVSGLIMLVSYRVFRELELKDGALIAAMAVICFHPTFFVLAGSLNNDNLMVLFVLWAFLLTLRWRKEPSVKTTVLLALAIGLGMMTKLSAVLVTSVTAYVFCEKLAAKQGRETVVKRLMAFFSLCVPLGLWHTVYMALRFKVAPGYVQAPGVSIYIGHYSLAHRFLYVPAEQFSFLPFCQIDTQVDNNVPMYIIKSSLFGEFRFAGADFAATALVWVNIALIALSLAAMAYALAKRKGGLPCMLWCCHMAGYIGFNIALPYICTMDFRYLVPSVLCGAGFLGIASAETRSMGLPGKLLRGSASAALIVFCALSVAFYLTVD